MAEGAISALGPVAYARYFNLYRKPDANGNYPPRSAAEQKALDDEIAEWSAIMGRPT